MHTYVGKIHIYINIYKRVRVEFVCLITNLQFTCIYVYTFVHTYIYIYVIYIYDIYI